MMVCLGHIMKILGLSHETRFLNAKLIIKIHLNKNPARIEQEIPPIKPTKLLFGLAATYPLVDFPNKTPKNQARESQIKTNIKNKLIM